MHTKWPPFKKPSSVLDLRSWLCDVRLVELRLSPHPPDIIYRQKIIVKNNENNRAQKHPLYGGGGQVLIQVQLSAIFDSKDNNKK